MRTTPATRPDQIEDRQVPVPCRLEERDRATGAVVSSHDYSNQWLAGAGMAELIAMDPAPYDPVTGTHRLVVVPR